MSLFSDYFSFSWELPPLVISYVNITITSQPQIVQGQRRAAGPEVLGPRPAVAGQGRRGGHRGGGERRQRRRVAVLGAARGGQPVRGHQAGGVRLPQDQGS